MPCVTPLGVSLLGAALSALGSTAVVSDVTSKVHSHSCITVINSYHGHLLSRRSMGQAQVADVGLWEQKQNLSALSLLTMPWVGIPALYTPCRGGMCVMGEVP